MVHHDVAAGGGGVRAEAGGGEPGPRLRAVGDRGKQAHSTQNPRRNHRARLGKRPTPLQN